MMNRRLAFTTFLLITTATPALAAASPEGAARIASALQTYLGSQSGVVTVTPQGETYTLKLDFNPLFAKANPADFSGSMSALEMTVTEQGGGKWKVDQDQAIEFSFKGGGVADIAGKLTNYKGTGVFDEALGYFESSSGTLTGLTYNQVMTMPGEGAQNVTYTIGAIDYSTTMSAGGADSVNGTTHYNMTNLAETISMPANPAGGTPPIDLTINLASMTQDATVKGMKFKPLTNIVAFLVAHPSKELMIADQTAFKDHLRSAFPWFDRD